MKCPAIVGFVLVLAGGVTAWADAGIRTLPVPAATILPGQIIAPQDLAARKFRTTPRSLAGIATTAEEITGKQARRKLLAGKPVPSVALVKPISIPRGTKATASYEAAGISISVLVIALQDGAPGEVIDVRNMSSGVIIRAEVMPGGQLIVRMK